MNTLQSEVNTCFFTGHRSIPMPMISEVTRLTRKQIYLHASNGYVNFLCGGAVGFDTIAAVQVLRVKAGGAPIHLTLALPCRDQTALWKDTELLRLYQRIKGSADEIIYVSDLFHEGCMRERNQFMVDSSSACIAYFNGSRQGGTAQTVRMAEKKNIPVVNIFGRQV